MIRSRKHLDFIKTLPCVMCMSTPCDPEHLRKRIPHEKKGGTGLKPCDSCVVPLCRTHHQQQHSKGFDTFWGKAEPYDLANLLFLLTGQYEKCVDAIVRFRLVLFN